MVVIAHFFLGWIRIFFAGFTCWVSSGFVSTIGTLGDYAWVNDRLDWYEFLIWVYYWFTCWSFSWYAPATDTLGGNAGEVYF